MDLKSFLFGIIIGLVVSFGAFSFLGNRYEMTILGKQNIGEKVDFTAPQSHLVGISIFRLNKLTGEIYVYLWGTGSWHKLEH